MRRTITSMIVVLAAFWVIGGGENRLREARAATSNNTSVFWVNGGTSQIKQVKSDGTGISVVGGLIVDQRAVTTDGQHLYFTLANSVYRSNLDGSSSVKIADTASQSYNLFVDATYVYYSEWSNGVFRVVKSGGTPEQIITSAESSGVLGAVNSTGFTGVYATTDFLYFVTYGASGGTHSALFRSDLAGTTASVALLYADGAVGGTSSINANDVWVTPTKIWLADFAGSRGIITLNLDGTNRSTLFRAGRSYRALEIAGDYVYYTTGTNEIGRFPYANNSALPTVLVTSSNASDAWDIAVVDNPTVTYAGGGADGGSEPIDSNVYVRGDVVTVMSNVNSLSRNGYQFAGWRLDHNGATTYPSAGSQFTLQANATITAEWIAGPLEYSSSSSGSAQSSFVISNAPANSSSSLTIYARNMGATARSVTSAVLSGGQNVSLSGGTCSPGAPVVIQPYAPGASPDNTCTYVLDWAPTSASEVLSASLSVTSGVLVDVISITGTATTATTSSTTSSTTTAPSTTLPSTAGPTTTTDASTSTSANVSIATTSVAPNAIVNAPSTSIVDKSSIPRTGTGTFELILMAVGLFLVGHLAIRLSTKGDGQ